MSMHYHHTQERRDEPHTDAEGPGQAIPGQGLSEVPVCSDRGKLCHTAKILCRW